MLGKERLQALLPRGELSHAALAGVVGDRHLADPAELQRQGLNQGMDPILSAQFITAGSYGTRSSTTLWVDSKGFACWRESSFDARGSAVGQREETFGLEGSRAGL
jgi:uncharacterized protein with NRDE domain